MDALLQEYKTKIVPDRTKELEGITSSHITYLVDWASFKSADELNFLDNVTFHRINMAFRGLCIDDVAKSKVKTIKTIQIKNVQDAKDVKVQYANGVIVMGCHYKAGISGGISDSDLGNLINKELCIKEAQLLHELQTQVIPNRLKEFEEIIGVHVPFDIDWSSFHNATSLRFFDNMAILRLNMAFRGVCTDEPTKVLVRQKVKKIQFKNVKTPAETTATLSGGALSIAAVYDRDSVPMGEGVVDDKLLYALLMKEIAVKENQIKLDLIEKTIPSRAAELSEIFGTAISYEINWSTFETVDEFNFLDNCSCHRINMAFRGMKKDTKAKLQKLPLQKIRLINIKDKTKKTLKINPVKELELTCAFGSGLDGCFSDNVIAKYLDTFH